MIESMRRYACFSGQSCTWKSEQNFRSQSSQVIITVLSGHHPVPMIRIPGNVVFGRLLTPLFNTYVRGLSIGSQSGIAAILAMDSLDASSRPIGRPSGDLEKRGGEEGGGWRGLFFPRSWGWRLLVLLYRYRSGECPTAAKGGCCFLRTGRSWPHQERWLRGD